MTTYNSVIDRTDAAALIPEDAARQIVQGATEQSAVMRLARRLPDLARAQQRIPVLSALPVAYFVSGDTGIKQTTEANWDNVYLDVAELAAIVPIPQAVLDDATYDIWGEIRPLLAQAFGAAFDKAVLFGTNAPAAWPDDVFTAATAAGNALQVGGVGSDLYDTIMGVGGLLSLVEDDGFFVNGHMAALSMRAQLRGLRDTNGVPLFVRSMTQATGYELDGSPIDFPRTGVFGGGTALMFSGDWSQLVYALRQDITYKIATEGVIMDGSNAIVYNLFQQDMVALRAVMRVAWQVPNPINLTQATAAHRYPFAVLKP